MRTYLLALLPACALAVTVQAKEKDFRNEPPDPCVQVTDVPGKALGLERRCETLGTGGGVARGDFNGDGIADLAIGVPYEDVDGVGGVGAVNVIYGSAAGGLTSSNDQVLYPTTFSYPLGAADHFGSALAAGDFNDDGYADLAIGMPDYNSATMGNAGAVLLIDGSPVGLNTATVRALPQTVEGRFGAALVWADFNDDEFADLAVGAPGALAGIPGATYVVGAVHVYYGGRNSLTAVGLQRFRGNCSLFSAFYCFLASPPGDTLELGPNTSDRLGAVLTAGDFNGDGRADLAMGVPFYSGGQSETDGESYREDSGRVAILPGSVNGLSVPGLKVVSQSTSGVGGSEEDGDNFGRALAAGDLNGDGRDDLVVGIPFEDLIDNTRIDAGAIQVFFGTNNSALIDAAGDVFLTQDNFAGVSTESDDLFGWALAVGDFDGDGRKDLAVGSPGEDAGTVVDAGVVNVIYGSASGLNLNRTQTWFQGTPGISGTPEVGDQFGYALSSWNYGRSSHADLAIGVPFEDLVNAAGVQQVDTGAVHVLYGSGTGLSTTGAQFWTQDSPGINDVMQPGDRFGSVLY